MDDSIFNGMKIPQLDISYTSGLASSVQAQIDENIRRTQEIGAEAYQNRQRMQHAMEQTAANTAETNSQLQQVVKNQNEYIELLKQQVSIQKQQLDFDEQQLDILKNIFASEEDGVAVEKELMKLIQGQIDSSHPLWDYVKDKGGDLAVAGITAGASVLYNVIKLFLASKGIQLP